MVEIFNCSILKLQFELLYKELIPNLNICGNCGIRRCAECNRFNNFCHLCKMARCEHCFRFLNCVEYLYNRTTLDEWNYICNFIHNFLKVSFVSMNSFEDLGKTFFSSILKTVFLVSTTDPCLPLGNKQEKSICYIYNSSRKFRFVQ